VEEPVSGTRSSIGYEFADHRRLLAVLATETPALVMDLGVVRRRLQELRAALGHDVAVHFAVKSNPTPRVLSALLAGGASFEIASAGELPLVLGTGISGSSILFSATSKRRADIMEAAARGVRRFSVGTEAELHKLLGVLGPDLRPIIRLRVRDGEARWGQSAVFGVGREEAIALAAQAGAAGCDRIGVGFHVGSQARPGQWSQALAEVAVLMDESPERISLIDLGGGFPTSYPGAPLDHRMVWETIGAEIATARRGLPYQPDVVAEPGRALVADAGTLYTTVVDIDPSRQLVRVDAGVFHGLFEGSGAGGGLRLRWEADHRDPAVVDTFHIGGISCDADDQLATPAELPVDLAPGEILAVRQAGAYSLSYASDFCGLPPPQVVLAEGRGGGIPGYEVALPGSPAFDEAVMLEHEVFARSGFLEPDGTLQSFRRYDAVSRFIVTRAGDGSAATAMRVVEASPMGFTVLHKMPISPMGWDLVESIGFDNMTEVLSLSSSRPSVRTSVEAYAAGWFDIKARGREHFVTAIDARVLAMIERRLGNIAIRLGDPVDFMGSPTVPVVFDLRERAEDDMRSLALGSRMLESAGLGSPVDQRR
jgi:ornithine decarboxylase